jgi:hypothetical protein
MTMLVASASGPETGIDTRRVVTQLGVRFWDYALARPITNGLSVLAWALDAAGAPVRGVRGPSGIISFHGLPGTRALEFPRGLDGGIASPPAPLRFVITVADSQRRFLPETFTVELPFLAPATSPLVEPSADPLPLLDAYLFSAPTRPVTTGMSAIRADLWDADAGAPASHAVLTAHIGDRATLGVADANGQMLLLFPTPLVERLRFGSPPGAGQSAPESQTWPVMLEASYSPDLDLPFGHRRLLPEPWTSLPSLKAILDGQSPSLIYTDAASPPSAEWHGEVEYGRELTLRTLSHPSLWLSRGSSPP